MNTYKSDFELSRTKEIEFGNYLRCEYKALVEVAPDTDVFQDWDVSTTATTKQVITYEVKYSSGKSRKGDDTSSRVYVELHHKINGKELPSGLSATKADYYTFCFADNDCWYIIPVLKLKELVSSPEHYLFQYYDYSNYLLTVFSKQYLLKYCIPI